MGCRRVVASKNVPVGGFGHYQHRGQVCVALADGDRLLGDRAFVERHVDDPEPLGAVEQRQPQSLAIALSGGGSKDRCGAECPACDRPGNGPRRKIRALRIAQGHERPMLVVDQVHHDVTRPDAARLLGDHGGQVRRGTQVSAAEQFVEHRRDGRVAGHRGRGSLTPLGRRV
jgi:hypothetical protein